MSVSQFFFLCLFLPVPLGGCLCLLSLLLSVCPCLSISTLSWSLHPCVSPRLYLCVCFSLILLRSVFLSPHFPLLLHLIQPNLYPLGVPGEASCVCVWGGGNARLRLCQSLAVRERGLVQRPMSGHPTHLTRAGLAVSETLTCCCREPGPPPGV